MEAKSLNCASCGAGLKYVALDHAKCCYCGNTNKILGSGVTMVVNAKKPTMPSHKRTQQLTSSQKMLILLCVCIAPIILHRFLRR